MIHQPAKLDETIVNDINLAIPTYFSVGVSSFPWSDWDRVVSQLGNEKSIKIEAHLKEILQDIDEIKPDWNRYDLLEATNHAVAMISKRHPYLNKSALDALGWAYSYGYK